MNIFCGGIETNLLSQTYGTTGATQVNAIDFSLYTHIAYGANLTASAAGALTIYGETYRGSVMAKIHTAGGKFLEVLEDDGYLHSIVSGSTLTTKSTALATYITNIMAQLNKSYSGQYADGILLDFETQSSAQTTSDLDIFITHLYTACQSATSGVKIIIEYAGYYMRYSAPNYLPSPSVANSKLEALIIGCYGLITAAACEAEMPLWVSLGYSKSKLACNITGGVMKVNADFSTQYYGMYSDLWNSFNNTGITDLSLYSKTFVDFYTYHNPEPGSLAASGWYYGVNAVLKWFCVNETIALSQWIKTNGYGGMGMFQISYDMITYPEYSLSKAIFTGLGGVTPTEGTVYFGPGQQTTANIAITISPSGVPYTLKLTVGNSVANSSPFTSTGATQNIPVIITLPTAIGEYDVLVDAINNGRAFFSGIGTDSITIVSGVVGPITWQ